MYVYIYIMYNKYMKCMYHIWPYCSLLRMLYIYIIYTHLYTHIYIYRKQPLNIQYKIRVHINITHICNVVCNVNKWIYIYINMYICIYVSNKNCMCRIQAESIWKSIQHVIRILDRPYVNIYIYISTHICSSSLLHTTVHIS